MREDALARLLGRGGPGAARPVPRPGVRRLGVVPTVFYQGRTNACGPYSLAMAASCYWPGAVGPEETARRLRLLRVPGIGATLPWGIALAGRAMGLEVRTRWLGQLHDLRRCVDEDHPAIVLVHPDDFAGCPWYALHYRVLVGYRDDPDLAGGGELYFACSARPAEHPDDDRPGNLALSYSRFARQWHTYLTVRWYAEVGPPRPDRARATERE